MKNRKVEQLKVIEAVQLPREVITSIDSKRHNVEMSLTPPGVMVEGPGITMLVPYANVAYAKLEPEAAEQNEPTPTESPDTERASKKKK